MSAAGALKCRRLMSTTAAAASSAAVKPFESIPELPGRKLPYFGHMLVMIRMSSESKANGLEKAWKSWRLIQRKFVDADGANMIRMTMPPIVSPNPEFLHVFDPADVETVYRNEGKYPFRGNMFASLKLIRQRRPDAYPDTTGITTEEGEEWHRVRSQVII